MLQKSPEATLLEECGNSECLCIPWVWAPAIGTIHRQCWWKHRAQQFSMWGDLYNLTLGGWSMIWKASDALGSACIHPQPSQNEENNQEPIGTSLYIEHLHEGFQHEKALILDRFCILYSANINFVCGIQLFKFSGCENYELHICWLKIKPFTWPCYSVQWLWCPHLRINCNQIFSVCPSMWLPTQVWR